MVFSYKLRFWKDTILMIWKLIFQIVSHTVTVDGRVTLIQNNIIPISNIQ